MEEYTQEEILDMYFERSQQAVAATAHMYGSKLIRFAENMVCKEDAVECVNDTYMCAWTKIPPERPVKFLSWLYKVLRNIVCDRIDWNNAAKRSNGVNAVLDELAECVPDSAASYEGELSDIGRSLSDFLRNQDKEKRILFVRRYWYGMSIAELARESNARENTIKTQLYRIRGELKEYLKKEGYNYE